MRGHQEKREKLVRGVRKSVRVRSHREVLGRKFGLDLQFHSFLDKR
jgi:hypothetical protein